MCVVLESLSYIFYSLNSIEKKEDAALRAAETKISSLNMDVNIDIQTLFDKLHIIYRCSWRGNSIILLEEYIIEPPYTSVKVLPGATGDAAALDRLSKIVSFSVSFCVWL